MPRAFGSASVLLDSHLLPRPEILEPSLTLQLAFPLLPPMPINLPVTTSRSLTEPILTLTLPLLKSLPRP